MDVLKYNDNHACDGVVKTNILDEIAYQMILEKKNEIGLGDCDPTVAGALYYQGYWSQPDVGFSYLTITIFYLFIHILILFSCSHIV